MSLAYQYTALVTSLPKIDHWFHSARTPISAFQLNNRLIELDSNDANDIGILIRLIDWSNQGLGEADASYLQLCNTLLPQVQHAFVRDMIVWRLEWRTVVAAFRHKYLGKSLDDLSSSGGGASRRSGISWGYGRWTDLITAHWGERDLGLSKIFPRVLVLQESLEAENPFEGEKFILDTVWEWLDRIELGHEFDLVAVAIYRMRWEIVNNWVKSKEGAGNITFQGLLQQALNNREST